MSPQSRVPFSEITASYPCGDGGSSCNACSSSPLSVAEIAWAKDASYVHTIGGSSSDVESSRVLSSLGKRGSDLISTTESSSQEQPFLSSYGSAFLSGIFADIAEAQTDNDATSGVEDSVKSDEPSPKKGRPLNSTLFGGQTKSFMAFDTLIGGAVTSMSAATVSPRPKKSSIKIELFDHQVRELQNLAFPSLPGIPVTVSSSSCTIATLGAIVTPRDLDPEEEHESFGWFVSTDDDDANINSEESTLASMFLPHTKPTPAFQAPPTAAPKAEKNVDVEVQQALAADTIDDVLGDLF